MPLACGTGHYGFLLDRKRPVALTGSEGRDRKDRGEQICPFRPVNFNE